jgi:hypothetical protein
MSKSVKFFVGGWVFFLIIIHIFVFCPTDFFWNRLFLRYVSMNIWIYTLPIIVSSYGPACGSSTPEHKNLQETIFARNFPRLCRERTATSQSKWFLYFCCISSHVTKHGSQFPWFQWFRSNAVRIQKKAFFFIYLLFHGNHIIRRDLIFPNINGAFHEVYQSLL